MQVNANNSSELNSFNKRTGRFESNGGWRSRKTKQFLNTNVDEMGRPMQKVALLCGPPGLGKTTLAHTIARHAGYNVREINASDDRSPEAFKSALENGTQMSSVMNEDRRPNCIILGIVLTWTRNVECRLRENIFLFLQTKLMVLPGNQ